MGAEASGTVCNFVNYARIAEDWLWEDTTLKNVWDERVNVPLKGVVHYL